MLPRPILVPVGFAAVTLVVLGSLSLRPDAWGMEASTRASPGALHGSAWFIAKGKLANERPTGILFDAAGLLCTGTQVEKAECILTAAHCKTKTLWAAHKRDERAAGLPIDPPFTTAPILSATALGSGTSTDPWEQAKDLAILRRKRNAQLPGEFLTLDLRPPKVEEKKGRLWQLFGRGPNDGDDNTRARVFEAFMEESWLHEAPEFGPGSGALYNLVPWDNGDGGPDTACAGDSGGPSMLGAGIRGVISGGENDSFGSVFTGLQCGSATSNQVASTSLNGNADFLTFAVAQECCVCIPPERSPFCHIETVDGKSKYACWNGAQCNINGVRPEAPNGSRGPLCHHEGCFDEPTGEVFAIPRGVDCGGGGHRTPPAPPGDPVPPPQPSDPVPPPSGKGGAGKGGAGKGGAGKGG